MCLERQEALLSTIAELEEQISVLKANERVRAFHKEMRVLSSKGQESEQEPLAAQIDRQSPFSQSESCHKVDIVEPAVHPCPDVSPVCSSIEKNGCFTCWKEGERNGKQG